MDALGEYDSDSDDSHAQRAGDGASLDARSRDGDHGDAGEVETGEDGPLVGHRRSRQDFEHADASGRSGNRLNGDAHDSGDDGEENAALPGHSGRHDAAGVAKRRRVGEIGTVGDAVAAGSGASKRLLGGRFSAHALFARASGLPDPAPAPAPTVGVTASDGRGVGAAGRGSAGEEETLTDRMRISSIGDSPPAVSVLHDTGDGASDSCDSGDGLVADAPPATAPLPRVDAGGPATEREDVNPLGPLHHAGARVAAPQVSHVTAPTGHGPVPQAYGSAGVGHMDTMGMGMGMGWSAAYAGDPAAAPPAWATHPGLAWAGLGGGALPAVEMAAAEEGESWLEGSGGTGEKGGGGEMCDPSHCRGGVGPAPPHPPSHRASPPSLAAADVTAPYPAYSSAALGATPLPAAAVAALDAYGGSSGAGGGLKVVEISGRDLRPVWTQEQAINNALASSQRRDVKSAGVVTKVWNSATGEATVTHAATMAQRRKHQINHLASMAVHRRLEQQALGGGAGGAGGGRR